MIAVFTGISGMQIAESLSKFASEYIAFKPGGSHYGKQPVVIKLDSEIERIFLELTGEPHTKRVWINKILLVPYHEFKNYWLQAMDQVINRISEIISKDPDKVIFVNLHCCYFHNRTQEYLSFADFSKVRSLNPDIIITFIDDIYDIHKRLSDLGGIYHDYDSPNATDKILRYFSLLEWRAKETLVSKLMANELKKDHYILATKHSYTTLFNIVYKESQKAYLSHPITEVRRLEKEGFLQEASDIKYEIDRLSVALSAIFTTFLPTTIDEYRITSETAAGANKKKLFFPRLTKRWDEEKYEVQSDFLFRVPLHNQDKNLLVKPGTESGDEELNHLLAALSNRISNQVTTRDYSLVEQSDVLIIYRPLFNGNASGGVQEEFRYYLELGKNDCYTYCPQSDIQKFYTKQLNYQISYHINNTERLKARRKIEEFQVDIWERAGDRDIFNSWEMLADFIDDIFDDTITFNDFSEMRAPLAPDELKKFKQSFSESLLLSFSLVQNYRNNSNFQNKELSVDDWVGMIYDNLKIKI